jgi:uncharacterized protein (DUF2236 family)
LALQATHPIVASGIRDHSNVFEDPWRRLFNSYQHALELLFDDTARKAREIRELHRSIAGVGYDGRPYHAWNPQAWTWIHLTTFEGTLYALEAIDGPIDPAEQRELYEEWKAIGRLYGVRDRDTPGDVAGLQSYIRDGTQHLVATPTVDRLLKLAFEDLPPLPGVPNTTWRLARPVARRVVFVLLTGAFPPEIRHRLGIAWTGRHDAEYGAALGALRRLASVLPDRLRLLPIAYDRAHG